MDYLQLVNDFLVETGMEDPIESVIGQIDDSLKATTWIRDAWVEIQRAEQWKFRWAEGSFATVASQQRYTQVEQGMTAGCKLDRGSLWIPAYKSQVVESCADRIRFLSDAGRPSVFSYLPDDSIELYFIPDAAYTITYEYWRAPVVLTLNTDTPTVSPEWHKAIVWKAIVNYAREQGREWDGLYQSSNREFNAIYSDMLSEFLPAYLGKRPL